METPDPNSDRKNWPATEFRLCKCRKPTHILASWQILSSCPPLITSMRTIHWVIICIWRTPPSKIRQPSDNHGIRPLILGTRMATITTRKTQTRGLPTTTEIRMTKICMRLIIITIIKWKARMVQSIPLMSILETSYM